MHPDRLAKNSDKNGMSGPVIIGDAVIDPTAKVHPSAVVSSMLYQETQYDHPLQKTIYLDRTKC